MSAHTRDNPLSVLWWVAEARSVHAALVAGLDRQIHAAVEADAAAHTPWQRPAGSASQLVNVGPTPVGHRAVSRHLRLTPARLWT